VISAPSWDKSGIFIPFQGAEIDPTNEYGELLFIGYKIPYVFMDWEENEQDLSSGFSTS
jgi:hypothetical protein